MWTSLLKTPWFKVRSPKELGVHNCSINISPHRWLCLCWNKIRCHIFVLAFLLLILVPHHDLSGWIFCDLSDFNLTFLLFFFLKSPSLSVLGLSTTYSVTINFIFRNFAAFFFSIFISVPFPLSYALIFGHNSSVISDKKPEDY